MDNDDLKTARKTEAGCLGFALFLLGLAMMLCLISVNGSALCFYGGLILLIVGGISLIPCFDLRRDVKRLEKEALSQNAKASTDSRMTEMFGEAQETTIHIVSATAEEAPSVQETVEPQQASEHPTFTLRPSPNAAEHTESKLRELEEKVKGK